MTAPLTPVASKNQDDAPKEGRPDKSAISPLDSSLLVLADHDIEFLRKAISNDDDQLRSRILEIQRQSYEIYPYPCVLSFSFVMGKLTSHPVYPTVLEAGKKGTTVFLDIGCAMGTDARRIVFDGYPASNVIGSDLRQSFIDQGHELYQDANNCKINFFSADMFDIPAHPTFPPSTTPLSDVTSFVELQNRVTHMYTALLFHLFDEASQHEIAIRVATLLKRESGAVIFGRHQGTAKESVITDNFFRDRFLHSPESWKNLWISVFTELEGREFAETRVVVDAQLTKSFQYGRVSGRIMTWSVSIL